VNAGFAIGFYMSGQGKDIIIQKSEAIRFVRAAPRDSAERWRLNRGRRNYVGAVFHFLVESLERIGAVQFAAVLLDEGKIIAAALPRYRRVQSRAAGESQSRAD
jgi:hypothetical protein